MRALFRDSRTIAVVGLSPRISRPSSEVASYLRSAGYRIVPVNPGHDRLYGERSYPNLTAAGREQRIDIVDIFRRSEFAGPIVDEALALEGVRLIWLQVGVIDAAGCRRAQNAGVPCVMDRCLMVEHHRLVG